MHEKHRKAILNPNIQALIGDIENFVTCSSLGDLVASCLARPPGLVLVLAALMEKKLGESEAWVRTTRFDRLDAQCAVMSRHVPSEG